MKLMTYNLLNGAPETLGDVISVINSVNPDFLTINEANTFANNDEKVLKDFAQKTGFKNYKLALSGEGDYHVAAFSKSPFKSVEEIKPLMRAGILSVVDTDLGEVSIVSTHLTPYTENSRLPEIDLIMKTQGKYANKVLMGDMNSLSEYDNYNPEITKSFNGMQTRKFTTDGKLRFDAIKNILSGDYLDSGNELKQNSIFTAPTDINEFGAHSNMRLDYIFISKSLRRYLKYYEVVKNPQTQKASDHFSVVVELL